MAGGVSGRGSKRGIWPVRRARIGVASLFVLVFDRAAVGAGRGDCDRLAGGDRVESGGDVIIRRLSGGPAGRPRVVDIRRIDQRAAAVGAVAQLGSATSVEHARTSG